MKRPDEVKLLGEVLDGLSDLPEGMASRLLDLAGKNDQNLRAAAIRELLEELADE